MRLEGWNESVPGPFFETAAQERDLLRMRSVFGPQYVSSV